LQAHGALDPARIGRAMKDPDSRVRAQALQVSEPHLKGAPMLAGSLAILAGDPDPQVRFQAALTLGEWKDRRALATLAQLAHTDSADPWFRIAILSSVADEAAQFFRMLLAKGETWADPQLLTEASAMIGGRQNPAELADWLATVPRLKRPEQCLMGLTRGLRLVGARNLRIPGADQSLERLLSSGSEPVQRAAWEASRYFELSILIQRRVGTPCPAIWHPTIACVRFERFAGAVMIRLRPSLKTFCDLTRPRR
jgi:HEAT repeat protein